MLRPTIIVYAFSQHISYAVLLVAIFLRLITTFVDLAAQQGLLPSISTKSPPHRTSDSKAAKGAGT
jgi:hypothetical protein